MNYFKLASQLIYQILLVAGLYIFLFYVLSLKGNIIKSYNIPDTNLFIHKAYTDTIIVKRTAPQWLKAL